MSICRVGSADRDDVGECRGELPCMAIRDDADSGEVGASAAMFSEPVSDCFVVRCS